jgi:hypothetical protein
MKKIFYIFSITFIILQSCSSGDNSSETNNDNNSLLERRWYKVSETYQGITNYPVVCNNNGHRDYVDFLSSNIADFNYVASSTGNNCSDQYSLEKFNWIKNGNTINLKFFGTNVTSETLVITELTSTTLKFTATNATTNNSAVRVYSSN